MPLKIGISCAIISVSRWIPALKRSPLWVKTQSEKNAEKAYAKERTGYIPQDAIPKMGNGEKMLQVAAQSQAKEPRNHRPYALLLETGLRTGD